MKQPACELCETEGGRLILSNECLRVVLVDAPGLPGFARVIWNDHVREMSDLAADEQQRMMQAVFAVERAQRAVLAPDKVNLASLGNVTPHLHWHVIPRFADDSHFPQPVWGETPARTRRRSARGAARAARPTALPDCRGSRARTKALSQPEVQGRSVWAGNSSRIVASWRDAAASTSRNWNRVNTTVEVRSLIRTPFTPSLSSTARCALAASGSRKDPRLIANFSGAFSLVTIRSLTPSLRSSSARLSASARVLCGGR